MLNIEGAYWQLLCPLIPPFPFIMVSTHLEAVYCLLSDFWSSSHFASLFPQSLCPRDLPTLPYLFLVGGRGRIGRPYLAPRTSTGRPLSLAQHLREDCSLQNEKELPTVHIHKVQVKVVFFWCYESVANDSRKDLQHDNILIFPLEGIFNCF